MSASMKLSSLLGSSVKGCSNTCGLQHTGKQFKQQDIHEHGRDVGNLVKVVVRQLGFLGVGHEVLTNTHDPTFHANKHEKLTWTRSSVSREKIHWTYRIIGK